MNGFQVLNPTERYAPYCQRLISSEMDSFVVPEEDSIFNLELKT
jgi:hypothetical protein